MTREEAIFYIEELQKTYAPMDKKVAEAVDMAIEALETQELYLKALERMIEFHKTFTRILDGEAEKGENHD